jgi:hypothetical protein
MRVTPPVRGHAHLTPLQQRHRRRRRKGKSAMTTIEERLNQHDWDPGVGDQLIGEITDISERETKYGPHPLLVVRDDNGEAHAVHCLRGGLLWPVVRNRPSVGDRIGIRYDGQTGAGNAHSYAVAFDSATETAPDWDRIATTQRERNDGKSAETGGASAPRPVRTTGVDAIWPTEPPEYGFEPPPDENW